MNNKFKIGLSLPTSYLSGNYDQAGSVWYKIFGNLESCMDLLRKNGVSSIELNDLHMKPPVKQIAPAIENILINGFKLTVHIFLPNFKINIEFPDELKELTLVLKTKNLSREDIPLVLHGHEVGNFSSRRTVIERTVADLKTLNYRLKEKGITNPIGLEICRHKESGPVGVTYEEILYMIDAVKEDNVGICWDMGHTLANIEFQNWASIFPSQRFLERVIHTHIHDLDENNKTHGPFRKDNDTLTVFLKLLKDVGYQGVFNFELYPERWECSFNERKNKILGSINNIREIIERLHYF